MSSRTAFSAAVPEIELEPAGVIVEIGAMAIRLCTDKPDFERMLSTRYAGFLNPTARAVCEIDVCLKARPTRAAHNLRVSRHGSLWRIERGDLVAEWDAISRRGWARQHANPYSIDAALRIVHTLLLAEEGGFLLHASSVVRDGRAFLFTGVSGAGKTTISQLAPSDATLLTDEISYIRRSGDGYRAYGTPFAGSLQKPGENISAPIAGAFLLSKGTQIRIEPVEQSMAARSLLRNILFFARDTELVNHLFEAALEFVSRVPVRKLIFTPEERVWDMIR